MLSHEVSSESGDCRHIRNLHSDGGCAEILLAGRATSKEVRYDALASSQRERMNFAISRERNMWNEVVVSKFSSKTQLDDIMKRTPSQKLLTTRWDPTEKIISFGACLHQPQQYEMVSEPLLLFCQPLAAQIVRCAISFLHFGFACVAPSPCAPWQCSVEHS